MEIFSQHINWHLAQHVSSENYGKFGTTILHIVGGTTRNCVVFNKREISIVGLIYLENHRLGRSQIEWAIKRCAVTKFLHRDTWSVTFCIQAKYLFSNLQEAVEVRLYTVAATLQLTSSTLCLASGSGQVQKGQHRTEQWQAGAYLSIGGGLGWCLHDSCSFLILVY